MSDFLYLIQCKDFYKIGVARNVEERLATLQTGNPFPLLIVEQYQFENSEIAERAIHQALAAQRVRGEWFSLSQDGVVAFGDLCRLLGGRKDVVIPAHPSDAVLENAEQIQDFVERITFFEGKRKDRDGITRKLGNHYWQFDFTDPATGKRRRRYGGPIDTCPDKERARKYLEGRDEK